MARLSEDFVLRQLGEAGLRVPAFRVAASPDEADAAARELAGPVVVKALAARIPTVVIVAEGAPPP